MEIIPTDKIKEGMVLSADVRDINSRLLLAKGSTIKQGHLRVFRIWGISEVAVTSGPNEDPISESTPDPKTLKEVLTRTKKLFKHVDQAHPVVRDLLDSAVKYRSRPGGDQGKTPQLSSLNSLECENISNRIKFKITRTEIQLPEIPSFISDLNEVIASPVSSAGDIAAVVNRSPSLAALLLKVVNSAFYGFPSRIDSISRAVTLLGSKEISGLALGISVMKIFKNIPFEIIDMRSFLRHSLCCATISRILGAYRNIHQTEQLFVSGLLHDIGRLIMFKYFPGESLSLLARARVEESPLIAVEKAYLGYRHTEVAGLLLRNWKLPYNLEDCIVNHHSPSSAQDPEKAAIVHMADIITNGLGIGSSGECYVPPMDAPLLEKMNFSPAISKSLIRQAVHKMASIEEFFSDGTMEL